LHLFVATVLGTVTRIKDCQFVFSTAAALEDQQLRQPQAALDEIVERAATRVIRG
jgi:hypothetical protein